MYGFPSIIGIQGIGFDRHNQLLGTSIGRSGCVYVWLFIWGGEPPESPEEMLRTAESNEGCDTMFGYMRMIRLFPN